MKYTLIILYSLISFSLSAQIKGNGQMITKEFNIGQIEKLNVQLYAKIDVDCSAEPFLIITAEENIMDFIGIEENEKMLSLDQKEWISPSQDIQIKIGAPYLTVFKQSTHDYSVIQNINNEEFKVDADIGNILLTGETNHLKVRTKLARINAFELKAAEGDIKIESWAEVKVNVTENLKTDLAEDSKLILLKDPKKVSKPKSYELEGMVHNDEEIRFFEFTLKNNSTNRHNFYVIGPKPDGSKFSYGFPMMPFQKREKNWTNGTKVYKVNNLGIRRLVKVIQLEDEGKVVDIFEK